MGKASSKKVARAASTGGGRTSRGARPWGWYLSMAAVVVLGSLVIVTSRSDRQAASNPLKSEKPRPPSQSRNFGGDHWHAAYGIYICDKFLEPIQSDQDPNGIHTHNDGIVHIHPFTRAVSGRKATFGVFADTVGLSVSEDHIRINDKTYSNGDKCGDKRAELQVFLNGDEYNNNPRKIRLRDRDLLVIAFAPGGAEIPKDPPSKGGLDNLNDVPGSPGLTTPSTVPAGSEAATTVPGAPAETSGTTAATTPTTAAETTPSTSSP